MLYRFEAFELDTRRRELCSAGKLVAVEPQVFDLLEYLVQNRERLVSKDDIIASVWGGRVVSESTLTSRINSARAAIGDDGKAQRLIKTIRHRGLRFVADVVEERDAEAPAGPAIAISWLVIMTRLSSQEQTKETRRKISSPVSSAISFATSSCLSPG